MSIMILGGSGTLGRELQHVAMNAGYDVFAPAHHSVPLEMGPSSDDWPDDCRVIINAAGLIPRVIDEQELPQEQVFIVNAVAPHAWAAWAARTHRRFVHVSTDCVFGSAGWHHATDPPNASGSQYGWTKAMGEPIAPALTVRTSFLADEPNNLAGWLRTQSGRVPGWTEARWNGGHVSAVAEAILEIAMTQGRSNLIHLAAAAAVTKYEILHELADRWDLDVEVHRSKQGHDRRLWPTMLLPPFAETLEALCPTSPS